MVHKLILTSQSNFYMSRGRQSRVINASLDNQDKCFQNSLLSLPDTGEGEVSKSDTIEPSFQPLPVYCKYLDDCIIRNCKFDCQIKKYYDRYGIDFFNQMGI